MTRVYYKEAVGAFVVFDISRGSTFEAVLKWKSDLDSKVHLPNGGPIPAVLLANKCDQKKEGGHNPSQMEQFCKEHGFTGWFETSAKVRSALRLYPLCCYLVNLSCNCKVFRWIYASGCWNPRKNPKYSMDMLHRLSVCERNAFRTGQWGGEQKDRVYIKIKMNYSLEQLANDVFCVSESSVEVLMHLGFMGYEVYCEAQTFLIFYGRLSETQGHVPGEDIIHFQD